MSTVSLATSSRKLPQAAHAEFACASQFGRIKIGLIKNLPFTADVTFTEWQLNADGTHKQRNGPIFVTHIARDSAGKVIFRLSVGWAQGRAPENGYEATTWQTTICNLEDQSTTSFTNTVAYIYRCGGSIPGLMRVSRSAFQHPDVSSKIPIDTLGTKELASIQVTGFRYPIENAPDSRMIEQWLSDSMEMVLSHTEIDLLNAFETQAVVLNLRRQEPPPELFQIPSDLRIIHPPCPSKPPQ